MSAILFSTARLNLRKITLDDAAFIHELLNSPDFLTNIGNRNIHTLDDARAYIESKFLPGYLAKSGSYIMELKDDLRPIGTCGIHVRDYLDIPDIGYSLLPQYYKQGYAYEASKALLDFARANWGLTQVSGMVIPANIPSVRLLEKLGLHYVSPIEIPNDPELIHLYLSE